MPDTRVRYCIHDLIEGTCGACDPAKDVIEAPSSALVAAQYQGVCARCCCNYVEGDFIGRRTGWLGWVCEECVV